MKYDRIQKISEEVVGVFENSDDVSEQINVNLAEDGQHVKQNPRFLSLKPPPPMKIKKKSKSRSKQLKVTHASQSENIL